MEEYFAPVGTDHQILDGRTSGPGPGRLAAMIAVFVFFVVGALAYARHWQERALFSVPDSRIALALPNAGQAALFRSPIAFTEPWKAALQEPSRFRIALGGDLDGPTWILAPIWKPLPAGFETHERHGLYRLAQKTGTETQGTQSLSLYIVDGWKKIAPTGFAAVRLHDEALQPDPIIIAWNGRLAVTSLPLRAHGEPSDRYEASYVLQQNPLDEAFLRSIVLNEQGLAPWRADLERVSWTGVGANLGWELRLRPATYAATAFVSGPATSTPRTEALADGSATRVYNIPSATAASSTIVIAGTVPEPSGIRCDVPEFVPFFRVRGAVLDAMLASFLSTKNPLTVLEAGSLHDRLAFCLDARVDVDK